LRYICSRRKTPVEQDFKIHELCHKKKRDIQTLN